MEWRSCARSSACRRRSMAEIHPSAIVYPGTVLGEGVKVLEGAVVGKQPTLSPRSTAKREELPPATLGEGTVVSTGAIVFAGTTIGARVILGDQSCVRERVKIGDDVVVGRGSLVENDTTIGDLTKIQADAYITAYSSLEDNVFIAPCVVTANDNFMGRTERRHELVKGPTIRRGARVGGGAVLCPGVEIGEEAFVGAGAVVTKDVPARKIVVGNPARVLRDVPEDELRFPWVPARRGAWAPTSSFVSKRSVGGSGLLVRAVSAETTSSLPQPDKASRSGGQPEQPVEAFRSTADRSRMVVVWLGVSVERCASRSAAAAATCGAANDVP